jgi:hypothetical protein
VARKQAKFLQQINRQEFGECMERFLLYSAAPVLCGAKPSVLITLKAAQWAQWTERGRHLCHAMGLARRQARRPAGQGLALVYDRALLEGVLADRDALDILGDYGYPIGGVSGRRAEPVLAHLMERLKSSPVFPHEIGVLLGYPPDDVAAFIEDHGKDCVCCRHWKVYHDPERANEIFRRIDAAKARALDMLERPVSIRAAARLLRAV